MYEDVIGTILGDLTPGYTPGQARVNALRGNEPGSFATGAGGMPGGPSPMQPPPQPMPPPGGASGSWGPPEPQPQAQPPMQPPAPRTALPQATGRPGTPTPPAPGSSPGGPPGPAGDPLMTEYADLNRREQDAFAEQQRLHQPPDRSAMEEMFRKQSNAGAGKLTLALAAQQAGPGFEPFQAQALKQYGESQAPMKMTGGTMTEQGFIEDPAHGQEMKLKQIEARITAIDRARTANLTMQERRRLDAEKLAQQRQHEQTLLTIAGMRQGNAASNVGTWQPVGTDPTTGAPVFHNSKTNDLSTIDAKGQTVPYASGAYGPKLSAAGGGGAGKGQVDPQHLIDLVGEARGYLKGATGSGLGARVDQGMAFFGKSTKGAEATAKLNTIGGALVMAQPRMEGPQSDKDVALYKAMAGNVADNNLPIAQRAAALDAIEQLARKYQTGEYASPNRRVGGSPLPAGGAAPQPQAGAAPVRVNTALEASKLPSGTHFITPDGQRRVRE